MILDLTLGCVVNTEVRQCRTVFIQHLPPTEQSTSNPVTLSPHCAQQNTSGPIMPPQSRENCIDDSL